MYLYERTNPNNIDTANPFKSSSKKTYYNPILPMFISWHKFPHSVQEAYLYSDIPIF